MPGGKYVRAIVDVDENFSTGESDSEEEFIEPNDNRRVSQEPGSENTFENVFLDQSAMQSENHIVHQVRKNKRKRFDQNMLDRLERMEKTVFATPGRQAQSSGVAVPPWLAPRVESSQISSNLEDSTSSQTKVDNFGAIRWDIRPFPQGIPTNKLWTEWCRFKSNFEIATDLNNVRTCSRAKLLYLLMGDQLQGLITAAKLCPSFDDPHCYLTLTQNISTYLRSLVDTTAEHEEFTRLKQEFNESLVTFYARVVEKASMCGYGNDENRFIRSQILHGMSNRDVANAARTYNHDIQSVIQAATRAEAFNINAGPSKVEGIMEVTSSQRSGQKRPLAVGWNSRDGRGRANGPPNKRYPQNRVVGKHNRCFRCDRPKHYGKQCPALYKNCNTCNERGHFSATCRKIRVNNLGIPKEDVSNQNEQV